MNGAIQLVCPEDAAEILAIYAPIVRDTIISFELEPPSIEEMSARVRDTLLTHPWLVCRLEGRVVGYAYATHHRSRAAYRWAADVSVYTDAGHRRRGVARALYTALLAILPLQGFHAAFAGIALPNAASVALHETLGFTPVGIYRRVGFKLGAWHDVGWWQRDLAPRGEHPPPPRPLRDVTQTVAFAAALERGAALLPG